MDMPFIPSYEEVKCKGRFASFMTQLRADAGVTKGVSLDLRCGESDLGEDWFVDSYVYRAKVIDLDIRPRQHQGE